MPGNHERYLAFIMKKNIKKLTFIRELLMFVFYFVTIVYKGEMKKKCLLNERILKEK